MEVVTGPTSREATDDFMRAVYAEHGAALLGYATHLAGDRVRAEDLVQETLVRAWQHAGRLAGDERPLRPWLFTVLTNVARDAHRARQARPAETSDAALQLIPADDELERALQAWQVADALRNLSADHRAALIETYYLGRSVNEAGRALGVPPGTVRSRCYYALKALRLALQEKGYTP
jgi:RNA polymerase sigma-70 factor (ECF subfamily)